MNSIRVAHICQSDDVNIGGSLSVARELVAEQRRCGVDARLVFLYGDNKSNVVSQKEESNVYCKISRHQRWTQGVVYLRNVLKHLDFHIIHHHDGIYWPRLSSRMLGIPLVTHGHLGLPTVNHFNPAKIANKFIGYSTDMLIAISEWVATSWERGGFPTSRIRLIPNGVNTSRFAVSERAEKLVLRSKLNLPLGQQLLLWVGRLHRETKGLERLVALTEALDPSVHLLIVGDGPDRPWLENEIRSRALNHVTILGKVDDPAEIYTASDAFLFTSHIEPFGLVLLEAAASGLPLYAFECEGGGLELLSRLKAVVTNNESVSWLAKKIELKQGESSRLDVVALVNNEYSWKVAASKTINIYRELLTK